MFHEISATYSHDLHTILDAYFKVLVARELFLFPQAKLWQNEKICENTHFCGAIQHIAFQTTPRPDQIRYIKPD